MAAVAPAGSPATGRREAAELEREGQLRSHQHERLAAVPVGGEPLGEEHHRRDADAAADEQQARPRGLAVNPRPIGPRQESVSPGRRSASSREPVADDLVEHLDPAVARHPRA